MLCKMVGAFESVDENSKQWPLTDKTIQSSTLLHVVYCAGGCKVVIRG